jgi:hypothetical protein
VIVQGIDGAEVTVFAAELNVAIVVTVPGQEPVIAHLTTNHCQALELAVTAARIEAEARGVGP